MRDLLALPKAHLHLHLEGAMRPATLEALAHGYGLEVPTIRGYGSFSAFAAMYVTACDVLRTPDDLARVVREVVEDAAVAGAVWVEPAFYPVRHAPRLGTLDDVVETVLDALMAAAGALGIGAGLMLSADRTVDPSEAGALADIAVAHRDRGVVSFGLANDEVGHPPEPFADAFAVARAGGLISAPHAGELEGPASVWGALEALQADRVQHGVRSVEDPELVRRLADAQVCLDVCPTSNVLLGIVPSLAAHPLPALLEAGVRCSINADDPLLFGPGLLEEYELCRHDLGLDDDALAGVARASVIASGAPEQRKTDALAAIDGWLAGG